MTASTTQAANGLVTHDAEGRDNVYAKELLTGGGLLQAIGL